VAEQAVVLGAGYYRAALLLAGAGVVLRCCSMGAAAVGGARAPPAPVALPIKVKTTYKLEWR